MNINNLSIILIIGALTAYCLYLDNTELAATGIGCLAGVLSQASKGATREKDPVAMPPAV